MAVKYNPFTGELIIIPAVEQTGVPSNPPEGKREIVNIFWDPEAGEVGRMTVEHEDEK